LIGKDGDLLLHDNLLLPWTPLTLQAAASIGDVYVVAGHLVATGSDDKFGCGRATVARHQGGRYTSHWNLVYTASCRWKTTTQTHGRRSRRVALLIHVRLVAEVEGCSNII
jgi:hypothetical protein